MKHNHKILAVILSLLLIIIDQITKVLAINNLKPIASKEIIKGVLNFTYVENTGAAFGLFRNNALLLGIVSGIMLGIILLCVLLNKSKDTFLDYTLMIIFAGGAGNALDRLTRKFVVDFVDLQFSPFKNFPVFNFADCCVTIGAFLLVLYIIKPSSRKKDNIFG